MSRLASIQPALPHPNLGPEPWPESSPPAFWWLAVPLVVVALAFVLARRFRRGRKRTVASPAAEETPPLDARERLIAWAESARAALIGRFGPSWAARTTEEILDGPEVAEAFGAEDAARLAELLRAADLAKFAGPSADGLQGEDWAPWIAEFAASAAGATSRISGR